MFAGSPSEDTYKLFVCLYELTVGVTGAFLRSGMSDMLGLLALPSSGLPPSTELDLLF